jgi:hypothetical protein
VRTRKGKDGENASASTREKTVRCSREGEKEREKKKAARNVSERTSDVKANENGNNERSVFKFDRENTY